MSKQNSWLTVGKLVSAHGLKGEVKVNPSSDFPERFTEPGVRWLQKDDEEPLKTSLKAGRQVPGRSTYVISFKGINNRDQAESIVGLKLLVQSTNRPKLKKGEFHLYDLIGLKVKYSQIEQPIGEVIDLATGGNDLLKIKLLDGRFVLIPFVREIVPEINLEKGWIVISPPPGLLDL